MNIREIRPTEGVRRRNEEPINFDSEVRFCKSNETAFKHEKYKNKERERHIDTLKERKINLLKRNRITRIEFSYRNRIIFHH